MPFSLRFVLVYQKAVLALLLSYSTFLVLRRDRIRSRRGIHQETVHYYNRRILDTGLDLDVVNIGLESMEELHCRHDR